MPDQEDLLDIPNAIVKRRRLLPWWVKIFIWIFFLFGLIVPIAITFGFLGKDIQMALYGLKTNQPFTMIGILIMAIFTFKAIVAYGLWFEKTWAVRFGLIDAYAGLCICIVAFVWNSLQPDNNSSFPLEILFLILYIVWLHKIYKAWSIGYAPYNQSQTNR